MNNSKKLKAYIGTAMMFSLFAVGCSGNKMSELSSSDIDTTLTSIKSDSSTSTTNEITEISQTNSASGEYTSIIDGIFSERDMSTTYDTPIAEIKLEGSKAVVDGKGASVNGSIVTVTDEGVYHISGTLDNGQIIVNSEAKVQLVLDNANITCADSSPIYVINANKTFITLAENSENSLTDGSSYAYEDESVNEPDAVIFSTDNLTVNGTGKLNINANYNEGITGKDDVVITNCDININSVGNSIKGKDYVAVNNANININSGEDGIKSTNITDVGLGFVYIESGTINITAQEDGIQTDTEFIGNGGTINLSAGGGISAAVPKQNSDFGMGAMKNHNWFDESVTNTSLTTKEASENNTETETTISTKGIKASSALFINNGTYNIDSADDSLHSNGKIVISGGELSLASGGDGIHADSQIDIINGNTTITDSYEGIESTIINIKGGLINLTSSDDGINASDGSSQSGMGSYSTDAQLNITGGTLYVNADGDGLDSNGDLTISDGTVVVNGPTNSGNGALDGNGKITCDGGLLVAAGSSGMAEYPDDSSSQFSVAVTLDSYLDGGTLVTLCNENGDELVSFAPAKQFNSIVISSPNIKDGEKYYIYTNGTSSSKEFCGLYENGGYNNDGEESGSFTASDITSFIGTSGGNFMGGNRNNRENMEIPSDENGNAQMPEHNFGNRNDFQMTTNENGMPEPPDGEFFDKNAKPPFTEN